MFSKREMKNAKICRLEVSISSMRKKKKKKIEEG